MGDEDRWRLLIEGLRRGDERAMNEFWERYRVPLERIAEKNLAAGVRRRFGPEDAVHSACRTFLRRVRGGEFQVVDAEALWRLLCAITLTKIKEQTRFHLRRKRGVDREQNLGLGGDDSQSPGFQAADRHATPVEAAEAAEFTEFFEKLLADFDPEERQIVDLKLQELTNDQIAVRLGSSERTVRRIFKRVKTRLTRLLDVS
jgi:RNA polymerase sigma factor (sigma-70 family)